MFTLIVCAATVSLTIPSSLPAWAQAEPSASDVTRDAAELPATQPPATQSTATQPPAELPLAPAVASPLPADAPPPAAQSATSKDRVSQQLQSIIAQAQNELDPAKIPNLEQAKQSLSAAISRLEAYIDLGSPNGQSWSEFLRLAELKQELQAERPSVEKLLEIELNMRQNYLGLEFAPYTDVRQGVNHVVRAIRYGYAPDQTIEQLQVKLQQLQESLDAPVQGAGTERSYAVGLIANYLHEMNQAPQAIAQIRQQFSVPNVRLYARESLINRVVGRPVAEPNPVNECLLGTHIVGQACLSGHVMADLLPMVGGVSLQLNLSAGLSTRSNGYNRGVVLGSTSFSPVFASKTITVTPHGISSSPASIATNLQTHIHSIDHKLKIVRKIAQRRAAEQKPLADAIAEGRMQKRVRSRYDQQVEEQLAQMRGQLSGLRNPAPPVLTRVGLPMPSLHLQSNHDAVLGHVHQAAAFQLAAYQSPSFATPATAEVVVEAHQSAVVNALDLVLGDRTIRSEDLDNYAVQLTGTASAEIQEEAAGEPWSITLASYRPVEIELDDNQIKFVLRVTQMTRGSQVLEEAAFVTAVYVPEHTAQGLTLHRQGEVEVTFARATRGLRVVTLRSFLKGKFDKFFKEQLETQTLDLQQRFPRLPAIALHELQIDDGWVQLGWR